MKNNIRQEIDIAKTFETLIEINNQRSKKIAWSVAGCATVVAVLCAVALAIALPLKQTELSVVAVDNITGRAQIITTVNETKMTESTALDKYFAALYVRLREQYNYHSLQYDYNTVQKFGTMQVNAPYLALYNSADAPDKRYQNANHTVAIDIISNQISPATDPEKLASIRFKRTVRNLRNGTTTESYAVVRLTFRYSPKTKQTEADREINPLGFVVTSYQVDDEVRGGA